MSNKLVSEWGGLPNNCCLIITTTADTILQWLLENQKIVLQAPFLGVWIKTYLPNSNKKIEVV